MGKGFGRVLAVLGTAAAMAAILWAGGRALERSYVLWNGALLPRDAQSLTLSGKTMRRPEAFLRFADLRQLDARGTGMTAAQYEWFRENLPDCHVLWDVPCQGQYYSAETKEITAEALTDADVDALQYLPRLKTLDLGRWGDYDRIRALKKQYPGLDLNYQVELAEQWWDGDSVSLALENADVRELTERLDLLESLQSVLLTGTVPESAQLQALQQQYPAVFFLWKMDVLGMSLETDLTQLDLSGIFLRDVAELEGLLPYFPNLEQLKLNAGGLDQQELLAMAVRWPEIHFVYDLEFRDLVLSTDAEESDLSYLAMTDTAQVEAILPAFHKLQKVVMCNCGIDSPRMDALNQKYEDIRFVWSVSLAGVPYRTDAVHFTPNRWGLSCDNENIAELRYCTDMVCVDIGHQVKVTDCSWVKNMPKLRYLVLAETGISDLSPLENNESIVFLELFLSKVKDYSVLATCTGIEDLNLCYTQGDPAPIGEMTWLKRLWWSGCWKARKELKDKLPDTYTEYLSLSSTGRGWREGQHYYDMRDFIGMEYMTG